ncbi:MAG TPA: radical SAM protein [Longimicrobiales bacterium]|nr:radical SAM protein [Longimicrobiales bacterium]
MTTTSRRPPLPVLGQRAASAPAPAIARDPSAPRVRLVTLGCDKNTVDSERQLGRLMGAGARLVGEAESADVVVINTCGFIDAAREESVDAILDAVRLKEAGSIRAVVAMGCLVQRYKEELETELPEVDLFIRLTEAEQLVPQLRARGVLPPADAVSTMERPLRVLSTRTRHTSYLKISEGCDHGCAFCAIPLMRGKHRSTPIDALVREAQQLSAAGVVELNVISQDTTWYGRDLLRGNAPAEGDLFVGRVFPRMAGSAADGSNHGHGAAPGNGAATGHGAATGSQAATGIPAVSPGPRPGPTAPARRSISNPISNSRRGLLPDLLTALLEQTDVPWLRLFYMYPSGISRELVELMAREQRIVPYLDMPIQHGADAVLTRMRRPERQATIRERVSWLREAIPDLSLRTTLIIGFPGETEDDLEELLELLEEVRFDHLGAFPYSVEEGTPAATMPERVPDSAVRERLERLFELQRSITMERNERWIGREATVLVDSLVGRDSGMDAATETDAATDHAGDIHVNGRGAVGRTVGQALEIDGVVHIGDSGDAQPGEFVRVRIDDVLDDDLIGTRTDGGEGGA